MTAITDKKLRDKMVKEKLLEQKKTIELLKQNTYEKKNKKNTIPEALISAKERHTIKEEPIQRMEKFGTRPKNRITGNRPCRFCGAPNLTPLHKCPALETNCNKCGRRGHYAKVCWQKYANKRTVKQLTEEENDDRDETLSESEESIHHIREIKKIEEKNKHYTATVKINGKKKKFIIDTGSPITIMPPDETILELTGIQKITKIPRCKQERSKVPGKNSGKRRVRKLQTENGHPNNRKNRHDTTVGNGLDDEIQTDIRKNIFCRR